MRHIIRLSHLLVVALLLALIGCAGGGGGNSGGGGNPFAGLYDGTIDFGSGKSGALTVTVDANGDATGTLTVTDGPIAQMGVWIFPNGIYGMEGIANHGGGLNLIGNVPNEGEIEITTDLPSGSSEGTFTVNVAGNTFTGAIVVHSTEAGADMMFTVETQTNAVVTAYSPVPLLSTYEEENGFISLFLTETIEGYSRSVTFRIPTTMEVGESITLTGQGSTAFIYQEVSIGFPKVWTPDAGTLTLTAKSGQTLSFQLSGAHMTPFSGTGSTGTFFMSGSAHN